MRRIKTCICTSTAYINNNYGNAFIEFAGQQNKKMCTVLNLLQVGVG